MDTQKDKNKKILIIEDETPLLTALSDKLSRDGFDVITAKNGEDGLSMALEHHPDMILLDITIPKMNGIEVLERLRGDDWGKSVKVIILSNHQDSERIASTLEEGVTGYIVKSNWEIEDVVEYIKKELGLE